MPQQARSASRRLTRDERIARIITVTRAMLEEMGHDGIVTAEVAKRCDISEATIYKYFDSKRDLLIQVAVQWFEELQREHHPNMTGRSTLEALRHVVWRSLSVVQREPALTRFILLDLRPDPAYRNMPIFELNRRFTGQVAHVLREGMRRGELRDDVPLQVLRDMIFGCIEHQTWAFLRGEGNFSIDEVTDAIVTVIYRGMQAQPATVSLPDLGDTVTRLERAASKLEQLMGQARQEGDQPD